MNMYLINLICGAIAAIALAGVYLTPIAVFCLGRNPSVKDYESVSKRGDVWCFWFCIVLVLVGCVRIAIMWLTGE
jgi:hypothetical protein